MNISLVSYSFSSSSCAILSVERDAVFIGRVFIRLEHLIFKAKLNAARMNWVKMTGNRFQHFNFQQLGRSILQQVIK